MFHFAPRTRSPGRRRESNTRRPECSSSRRCDRSPLRLHSRPGTAARRWPLPPNSGHRADENRSDSAELSLHRRTDPAGDDGRFPRRRPRGRPQQQLRAPDRDRSIVARSCPRPALPLRPGKHAVYGLARARRAVCAFAAPGVVSSSELERYFGIAFPRASTSDRKLECNEPCARDERNGLLSFFVQVGRRASARHFGYASRALL